MFFLYSNKKVDLKQLNSVVKKIFLTRSTDIIIVTELTELIDKIKLLSEYCFAFIGFRILDYHEIYLSRSQITPRPRMPLLLLNIVYHKIFAIMDLYVA